MSFLLNRRGLIAGFVMTLMSALIALPAAAGDPQIDAAKAAGIVGERVDGYLGIVDAGKADAALNRKVSEVNNKRRALYSNLAKQSGATVAQVARVTGDKQIAGTRPGHYYMDEGGSWKRK